MKVFFKTIIILLTVVTLRQVGFVDVNAATSTCEDAPEVYSISTSSSSLSQNEPFTLGIVFYNKCNHQIKEVLVNGVIYGSNTSADVYISSQGYTSTILPGGYKSYMVQIPMIYDVSMGNSFTITHFVYTYWAGMIPEDHIVTINQDFEDSILETPNPGDLPGEYTSSDIRIEYDDNGIIIYNEVTGQSERWEYDMLFTQSMVLNYIGDSIEFAANPVGSIVGIVQIALSNAESSTSLGDFTTDTLYDYILADNGLSDIIFNKATEIVIEGLQASDPNYVFPGGYMWVEGELLEVQLDVDGNIILDVTGNPLPLEDGNIAGEVSPWVLDSETIIGSWVFNFEAQMNDALGVNWNWSGWTEYVVNNPGFVLGIIALAIVGVLTFGIWWPIFLQVINIVWILFTTLFKFITTIFTLSSGNIQKTLEKQKYRKKAKNL